MEPKEQLAEVMKNTSLIALASSVEDLPNVRIVDIYFDEKRNVVVFPTSASLAQGQGVRSERHRGFRHDSPRPWTSGSCAECHRLKERLVNR